MTDLRTFLQDFLTTIEYPDNKEEFIKNFLFFVYLRTIDGLLGILPPDKQSIIKLQLENSSSIESLQQIVKENFEQKSLEDSLKINSEKIFSDYVQMIQPDLSDEQKNRLQTYFSSQKPA